MCENSLNDLWQTSKETRARFLLKYTTFLHIIIIIIIVISSSSSIIQDNLSALFLKCTIVTGNSVLSITTWYCTMIITTLL